ncbi:MAG: DUF58 domain-containing protein [Pseudomonadota bacterium]|nr:DUF58 domain-containing protein [Pseudomonadota bacterium]
MLVPQLNELVALQRYAHSLGLAATQRVHTPLSGLYASVFRGQGVDFEEVREYHYGDEIRNIDWRVTARMRKPFLKVYREERERHVILCVDIGGHMQFGTRKTFKAIQAAYAAALLGWSAQGHGDRVGGLVFGQGQPQFFQPNRSQRSFWHLLRRLTLEPSLETFGPTLTEVLPILGRHRAPGALIFIIADFNQVAVPALQRVLSQMHQRYEMVLISVDDPADSILPAMGKVRFVAANGHEVEVDTDSASGRAAYRQAWQQQRQQVQHMARQLCMDLLTLSTQTEVYQDLVTGLRQRAQKQQTHR